MNRLLAVCLVLASTSALAQTGPAADPAAPPPPATPAPEPAAPPAAAPAPESAGERVDREQVKREVLDEVRRALEKQKEEVRDEVRAQIATQTANRSLEEDFQLHESRRRLELFEIDGYLRMRPELFYNFTLGRGADPGNFYLFPPPANGTTAKTLAATNMRWRLEPTLNVSEDVRIRAQIDVFDRLVLGATPSGGFGINGYSLFPGVSTAQLPPEAGFNWLNDSLQVRRIYGEVNTPVGQLLFGRMGSHWGTGMLTNSGNCLDCDHGDTVDRIMFVTTRIAGHYVVPFLDFVSEGPTGMRTNDLFGQPFDREQLDDARDYGLTIAKRDTDVEIARKLGAGQTILNYGLYFVYRTQQWSSTAFDTKRADALPPATPTTDASMAALGYVPRGASLYVPDLWFKLQTQKLRLEFELAGVFGSVASTALAPEAEGSEQDRTVSLVQFGAVAQAEYKVIPKLDLGLELGFASGDRDPGMGNYPGRTQPTAGSIDGPQFCGSITCTGADRFARNFRFARDYRVDLILFREILGGITDAVYVKPSARYQLTEGFELWGNVVYSRAVYGESTPSSRLENGALTGDANLGIELDAGATYKSGDGFVAGIAYGVLFPLAGLDNFATGAGAETAQTVRGWFAITY